MKRISIWICEYSMNKHQTNVVNHRSHEIAVCSNSTTIQCYSAAIASIWQHSILNSVSQNQNVSLSLYIARKKLYLKLSWIYRGQTNLPSNCWQVAKGEQYCKFDGFGKNNHRLQNRKKMVKENICELSTQFGWDC